MTRTKITATAGATLRGPAIIYGVADQIHGYVDKLTPKEAMDLEEIQNGSGDTVVLLFTGRKVDVSLSFKAKTDTTLTLGSVVGTTLTVYIDEATEIDIVITGFTPDRSKGAAAYSIEGTYYPAVVAGGE